HRTGGFAALRARAESRSGFDERHAPGEKSLLPAILMRNWVLLSAGNFAESRQAIALALAHSNTPELLLQDGIIKLNQREFAAARKDFEEVLKKTPEDMRALQELANSYFLEKKDSEGIARIKAQVARVPGSAPFQAYLGQILLLKDDHAGAKGAFEAAKKDDPGYEPADVGLALLDSIEGNIDSARRILQALADQKKPNSLATLRLGMLE